MRLEAIINTDTALPENTVKKPTCPLTDYPAYFTAALEQAEQEKKEVLDMEGIGKRSLPSEDFQYMGTMEQAIMNFLREHEYPKKVRILCSSDEELKSYMVVYNFWYADEKGNRMNDGRWD